MSSLAEFVRNLRFSGPQTSIGVQPAATGRPTPSMAVQSAALSAAIKQNSCNDEMHSMNESWVELGVPASRASLCSSIDLVKQHSPSSTSPYNEQVTPKDILTKHTDWMWDWPSRPEAIPPANYMPSKTGGGGGTEGMTPPNSPLPDHCFGVVTWRNSSLVKADLFNVDIFFGLIVSNIITFVLGACVGFCVAKRLQEHKVLD